MAKVMRKPIIYDDSVNQHKPIVDGQFIDVEVVPLSSESGNILVAYEDGLFTDAKKLVSSAEGNQLVEQDGKLFVGGDQLIISEDSGNYIRKGTDNGAYLDGNDVLSNGGVNLLTLSEVDGKVILRSEDVRRYVTCVSSDEGNLIQEGSDGGAYIDFDNIVAKDDPILKEDEDTGKISTELDFTWEPTSGELIVTGVDGVEIAHMVIPTATSALRGVQFTDAKPDASGEAVEGTYWISLAFKFNEDEAWDGGTVIGIPATKGSTSAAVSGSYSLRQTVADGTFPDVVRATFLGESIEKEIEWGDTSDIVFTWSDGTRLTLSWGHSNGTELTFSGVLTPAIGILPGAWLRFVWLMADYTVQDMYIDVSKLIDVYVAGCGVSVDETDKDGIRSLSVVINPAGGLECDADNGVSIKTKAGGGLESTDEGLGITLCAEGGLEITADGCLALKTTSDGNGGGIETDETGTHLVICEDGGLEITADGCLALKKNPSGGIDSDAEGTKLVLCEDGGLEITADGCLALKKKTGGGIETDADGAGLVICEDGGLEITEEECLAVKAGDGIVTDENGTHVDEDWLEDWIENNGGSSFGSILDVYYVPTSAFSFGNSATCVFDDGDQANAAVASFTLPSGGSWIVFGAVYWYGVGYSGLAVFTDSACVRSAGSGCNRYAAVSTNRVCFAGGSTVRSSCAISTSATSDVATFPDMTSVLSVFRSSVICFRVA